MEIKTSNYPPSISVSPLVDWNFLDSQFQTAKGSVHLSPIFSSMISIRPQQQQDSYRPFNFNWITSAGDSFSDNSGTILVSAPFTRDHLPCEKKKKTSSNSFSPSQATASICASIIDLAESHNLVPAAVFVPKGITISKMELFPRASVTDFKRLVYNLLVENFNSGNLLAHPCQIKHKGVSRNGFRFEEKGNPEKWLPEMYAEHMRNAKLPDAKLASVFVQDLYKFYFRASVELLSKYFEKYDKFTYLYDDTPLFVPNGTLKEAEERMKNMKSRSRKKKEEV
jgi:hypothetical protein